MIKHTIAAAAVIVAVVVVEIINRLKGRFSQANGLLMEAKVGVF